MPKGLDDAGGLPPLRQIGSTRPQLCMENSTSYRIRASYRSHVWILALPFSGFFLHSLSWCSYRVMKISFHRFNYVCKVPKKKQTSFSFIWPPLLLSLYIERYWNEVPQQMTYSFDQGDMKLCQLKTVNKVAQQSDIWNFDNEPARM